MFLEAFVTSVLVLVLVLAATVAVSLPLWGVAKLVLWSLDQEKETPFFVVILGMVMALWILIFIVSLLAVST